MFNPFLSNDQQAVVVFWVWKTLAYWIRLPISLGCILGGFALQYWAYYLNYFDFFLFGRFWLGTLLLFAGNLFLLVRDVDNRVRFTSYTPAAEWEKEGF